MNLEYCSCVWPRTLVSDMKAVRSIKGTAARIVNYLEINYKQLRCASYSVGIRFLSTLVWYVCHSQVFLSLGKKDLRVTDIPWIGGKVNLSDLKEYFMTS